MNFDYRLDPPPDPPEEDIPMLGEDDMAPEDWDDYYVKLYDPYDYGIYDDGGEA